MEGIAWLVLGAVALTAAIRADKQFPSAARRPDRARRVVHRRRRLGGGRQPNWASPTVDVAAGHYRI